MFKLDFSTHWWILQSYGDETIPGEGQQFYTYAFPTLLGADWSYDDQDGGAGNIGSVVRVKNCGLVLVSIKQKYYVYTKQDHSSQLDLWKACMTIGFI